MGLPYPKPQETPPSTRWVNRALTVSLVLIVLLFIANLAFDLYYEVAPRSCAINVPTAYPDAT